MTEHGHLDPEADEALALSPEERAAVVLPNHWIGYDRAQRSLLLLRDLFEHPKIERMPNLLLVGESGNGKTTIIKRFMSEIPRRSGPGGEPRLPVAVMDMPSEPKEDRFWGDMLTMLSIPHRATHSAQRKKETAIHVLRSLDCRLLVIDEVHNIQYGKPAAQRHFLAVMKNLGNELKIPIVAVGTPEAAAVLSADRQIRSRFDAFELPNWKLDQDFLRLLKSFERLLPLPQPSNLTEREIAIKLFTRSKGTIGNLSRVLKRATVAAIRKGRPHLDVQLIEALDGESLGDFRSSDGSG